MKTGIGVYSVYSTTDNKGTRMTGQEYYQYISLPSGPTPTLPWPQSSLWPFRSRKVRVKSAIFLLGRVTPELRRAFFCHPPS